MRGLLVAIIAALVVTGAATAAQPVPKATTLTLDSFTLSPEVKYEANNFWCEYNNYGLYFANYVGLCPYQDYVASIHWKKVQHITEYQVCLKPVFRDYSPGFACYTKSSTNEGDPATLSMRFDSAAMFLNSIQGTTTVWVVRACKIAPLTPPSCSESNTVSAERPWTG